MIDNRLIQNIDDFGVDDLKSNVNVDDFFIKCSNHKYVMEGTLWKEI